MQRIVLLLALPLFVSAATPGQEDVVSVSARFIDFDGDPIQGVRLEARFIKGKPAAVSGKDGDARLEVAWPPERVEPPRSWTELPPLRHHLLLRAVGNGTTQRCWLRRVAPGGTLDLGTIRLATGGTIAGRVVDTEGCPVAGARVEACMDVPPRPEDEVTGDSTGCGGSYLIYVPRHGSPAFSDARGRYRLEGIPDTFVRVVARMPGSLHSFSPTVALHPGRVATSEDIVLKWADALQLIRGRVIGPGGVPFEDVHLSADDLESTRTWTRSDGRFVMVVPAGRTYTLRADSIGMKKTVKAGERNVVVTLLPEMVPPLRECVDEHGHGLGRIGHPAAEPRGPCILRGRILLGGKPPRGWLADLTEKLGGWYAAPVRSDGRFALRVPYPGTWYLSLFPVRTPGGVRRGIGSELELVKGEHTWSLDVPVGTVRIENLTPLPTLEELNRLPKVDPATGREIPRSLYVLEWESGSNGGGVEKFAGRDTVWRIEQVPAGEIKLYLVTRGTSGRPMGRHFLLSFDLEPGENKIVKLP